MREDLRNELLAMAGEDVEARSTWLSAVQAGEATEDDARLPQFKELDRQHADRLAEIVDVLGWPGKSLVGEDGAQAAWLLAQHADHAPTFQRRCLDLMLAEPADEVTPFQRGLLTDRVRAQEGRPEVYGTQGGPVEDPDTVDERRAELGLNTLAEHRAQLKRVEYVDGKAVLRASD